jgi:hypothetical protein
VIPWKSQAPFNMLEKYRIRFFAYIWLVYVTGGTLYSVFRIHLVRLQYRRHIVFGFLHTFGLFSLPVAHCVRFFAYIWLVYLPSAHCIRFFAYIWLIYVTGGTLYSIFHSHCHDGFHFQTKSGLCSVPIYS